jgi:hypothetical protein
LQVFDCGFQNLITSFDHSANRRRDSDVRLYSASLQLTTVGVTYVVSGETLLGGFGRDQYHRSRRKAKNSGQ